MSNYFTVKDELEKQFFRFPKALIMESKYKEMSRDAKFLYAILMDRYTVSEKNVNEGDDTWMDDNNRIYFVYDQEKLSELFGASEKTLRKYINELVKNELLEIKRVGLGKANIYYLKKPIIKDMIENKLKNKKSPTFGEVKDANKNSKVNDSICNNNNINTLKEENKVENNVSEVVKLLQDSKITGIKPTEADKTFTDINILKVAIEECIIRKAKSYGYLKSVYNTKVEDSKEKEKSSTVNGEYTIASNGQRIPVYNGFKDEKPKKLNFNNTCNNNLHQYTPKELEEMLIEKQKEKGML
ncbi:MAG: replication initiator protein A [Peptostreptococcaceae bacterium]